MVLALSLALLAAPPAIVDSTTNGMDAATPPPAAFVDPPPRPTLTVAVVDSENLLSAEGRRLAAREVRAVFAGIGVDVAVDSAPAGVPVEATGVVVPVVLRRRQPAAFGPERVMGLVLKDHDTPSPAWVFVDSVRSTLGNRAGSRRDVAELGVAVGRVVAHEVIHALAPRHPHASAGLMARMLSREGLVGRRPITEAACALSARAGLAALHSPAVLSLPVPALTSRR